MLEREREREREREKWQEDVGKRDSVIRKVAHFLPLATEIIINLIVCLFCNRRDRDHERVRERERESVCVLCRKARERVREQNVWCCIWTEWQPTLCCVFYCYHLPSSPLSVRETERKSSRDIFFWVAKHKWKWKKNVWACKMLT